MKFIIQIIEKELDNSIDMVKRYLKELDKLAKGSLSKKCIRGHYYYYLQHKENHKLISKYLGKLNKEEIQHYKEIESRRKLFMVKLNKAQKQVHTLKRLLDDKKVQSTAYFSYNYHMNIHIPMDELASLSKRHGLKELALFGSVLTREFNNDSDIDVLVEFLPQTNASLYDLVEIKEDLELIFNRKVDVVEKTGLRNPFRKKAILKQIEVLYAA